MSGITLHKELGLNARKTFCPRCGQESNGLAMVGAYNYKARCPEHGWIFGVSGKSRQKCPAKGCDRLLTEHQELGPREPVPGPLCDSCQMVVDVITEGGIAWRCADCGSEGAIKLGGANDDFVKSVRAQGALGVEFTKEQCPVCSKGGE